MVWRTDYSYDRYGNRFQNSALNTGVSYTAVNTSDINAGRNRFTSGVAYDAAGNITADTKFRGMKYVYDANNRVKGASWTDDTHPMTAVYDGTGQRVMTNNSGGEWRHMVRDIFGRIITEHVPGGWERDNIYRGGELIAVEEVGRTCYVLRDRLRSERVMMDGGGNVMARHDYQPFGQEISAGTGMRTGAQGYGGADTVRQRYAGTERDEWTGLEHTDWRKLESASGRWTTPDPYGGSMSTGDPQSMNRYAYVGNDPVNAVDPSGLFTLYNGNYDDVIRVYTYEPSPNSGHFSSGSGLSNFSFTYAPAAYYNYYYGAGGGITTPPESIDPTLQNAVDFARGLLMFNESCRNLFGNGVNPVNLLNQLTANGSIRLGDLGGVVNGSVTAASTIGTTGARLVAQVGDAGLGFIRQSVFVSATTTINSNSDAPFQSGYGGRFGAGHDVK